MNINKGSIVARHRDNALNRLESASEAGSWSQSHGYSRYGNRWVSASSVPLLPVTPTSLSRFDASTNRIVNPFSFYDGAGNQTQAGGGTFGYDAENRQTNVTIPGLIGPYTYSYDGEGRRVKRVVAGITRIYVYNGNGQMVAEYHSPSLSPSSPNKEFMHLGDKLLAEEAPSTGTSYITPDHLGSTRVVTDAVGNVHSRHDYLPFGKEIPIDFGGRSSLAGYGAEERILQRFTGKELDPETGLQYFGARYYSGRQGRFTSADAPLADQHVGNPQSWNLYSYSRNNPLRFLDPTGQTAIEFDECPGGAGSPFCEEQPKIEKRRTAKTADNPTGISKKSSGGIIVKPVPSLTGLEDPEVIVNLVFEFTKSLLGIRDVPIPTGTMSADPPKNFPFPFVLFAINRDKQKRHMQGTAEPGRSVLTEGPDRLFQEFAGKGEIIEDQSGNPIPKERFDARRVIGIFVDRSGTAMPTSKGIIHHSKTGAHIVPANPKER